MGLIRGSKGKRRLAVGVVLLALALGLVWGLSGALADSSSPAPASGKTILRVGWAAEPNTLNPFRQNLICEFEVTHLNYDYLVGVDAKTYQPKPELAVSWTHSDDGLTWTFKTREGVTWQDGVPFTAKDVAFTFNYMIKNELTNFQMFTAGVKSVEAPDDTTAVFHLSKPWALMERMYVPILPEHIWRKVSGKLAGGDYQNAPPVVGTGPFQVTSFTAGQTVELTANKNYWRGAPKIDGIVFQSYQNANAMAEELKSGAIDVAWGIPEAQFKQLQSTDGITAIAALRKGFEELGFNCYDKPESKGNPVLRDWKFRQALNWAVDKQQILDTAWMTYGTVASSVIQPGYFQPPIDYHWDPGSETYTFDLQKAGDALTAAGYPLKNGVRVDKDGKPIKALRLVARANSAESQRAGKLLASWFEQLGLKISYQVLDESALLAKQYAFAGDTYEPDYDMFIWDWVGFGSDPNFILSVFTTAQVASWSDSQFSDPSYDDMFAQQQTQMDENQRKDTIWNMQKLLYEKTPYITLVYARNLEAYSNKWTGWVRSPAPDGGVIYNGDTIDSYLFVHPATATTSTSSSSNTGLIAIVVIAVVVVIGIIAIVMIRRRGRAVEA